ncbi:hypothetical protein LFYK43_04930 [Ligilactobacillus salitolerans]|uniref:Uncharacterized protein n=1 Tax=Ligilactobacillus salitolerans TaxID=1808352 RepID=A0A401IRB0_9LACO|nr:SIR2 family protein [Ligilactobacillus salitolerans]GBG94034.1 hypothetical protein LFYK43_04930 [Ligilactobacillus salitolerans]
MNSTSNMALKHINEAARNNSLILFVGAGVSKNSGLPSWSELINVFKEEMDLQDEDDYLKVAQYYYDSVGQQKYFQKIQEVLQNDININPNEIHNQILRIRPRHIITTNYDSLIEDKIDSSIEKYEVIKQDSDIPYAQSGRYLIKMHGDLALKNIVLKEDDYLDYEKNFFMVSTLIKSLIMNNTVLFIGYSLNDSTFNSIFRIIQDSFGENAKKAYFYTADRQNSAKEEYYKHKGITVISDETTSSDCLGEATIDFLKNILSFENVIPKSSTELWDNVNFLDNLPFVQTTDVVSVSNLKSKALLYRPDLLSWTDKENEDSKFFKKGNEDKLIKFIDEKTFFHSFLGYQSKEDVNVLKNQVLHDAYELYLNHKYEEARLKFREIANYSFKNKDYWNYLLAEFNVNHIGVFSSFEGTLQALPEPITGINDPNKIIESLKNNGNERTKKLCQFFQDNIENFGFITKKFSKMNRLLDKLRNERNNYKEGGISWNSNLPLAKFEFQELLTFITANCITVFQYRKFKDVVNRYFECLLIAYDNSQQKAKNDFSETSSIMKRFQLDDIKNIIPYMDIKNIPALFESYGIKDLEVDDDVLEYIFTKISSLSKEIHDNYDQDKNSQLKIYIKFLSYLKIESVNKIVDLLKEIPINFHTHGDVANLLRIIVNLKDKISEDQYVDLVAALNDILNQILLFEDTSATKEFYEKKYFLYVQLIDLVFKKSPELIVKPESLQKSLELINYVPEELTEITRYENFIVNFYEYLSTKQQKLLQQIFTKYEKVNENELNIGFVTEIAIHKIYGFNSKKDIILGFVVEKLNSNNEPLARIIPNPKEEGVRMLFNFIQNGYFTLEQVKSKVDFDDLKGVLPEFDWKFLNIYSDEVIFKLVEKYNDFNWVKKFYGKTDEEAKILDEWLIDQAMKGKIEFKE